MYTAIWLHNTLEMILIFFLGMKIIIVGKFVKDLLGHGLDFGQISFFCLYYLLCFGNEFMMIK